MPRFFFQIADGRHVRPANEGIDLPDEDAAWREAITACGELIRGLDRDWKGGIEWRMNVTDETGAILFRLRFSAESGPKT